MADDAGDRSGLAARLTEVRERIAAAATAAGRRPADISVLAVTKGHPAAAIAAALDLGLVDIGESRVQEAQSKQATLGDRTATWHMVGHVQRNKARPAAAVFDVVHSVDRVALATSLDRHRPPGWRPLRVFIEVDLTGIEGRSGIAPPAVAGLVAAVASLSRLQAVGLMTIAPPGSREAARDCFGRLRRLRDDLAAAGGARLDELSMGMSDDFEVAVAEGSTVLRLGRVLFGEGPAGEAAGHPGLS
jgi:pyridoxal phosphate enzyme (YggS family)